MENFNHWFRTTMLKPDGRAIWWEHQITMLTVGAFIGLGLRILFHLDILYVVGLVLGALMGIYSYRQDRILSGDIKEADMRVPTPTKVYGVLYFLLMAWTLYRLFR